VSSETHELKLKLPAEARATAAALASELGKVEERAESGAEKLRGVARELTAAERTARKFEEAIQAVAAGTLTLKPENAAALAQGYEQAKAKVTDLGAALAQAKAAQKATTTEADKLRDGIRAATTEAKRLEKDGARATAAALKAAQKEAADLQKRLDSGKARDLADEVKRAAAEAGELKKRFADVTSLAGRVAMGVQQDVVGALAEFVRGIPEGSAAAERHTTVLARLGGAYQEVQRQTRGTVTAEQAYQVQQRLTESGLSLNAEQLGVVTRRARDYSRTVGVDLQQALDQLSEGLNTGSNEQLRKFGVTVQTGRTRTETFTSALRQLEQQQRGNAPAALSAGEAQAQFNVSLTQATQAAQAFLGQKLELTEFLSQAASLFRDLADGTRDWADVLETAAGTVGEMVGLRVGASNEGTQSTSTAFAAQYANAERTARALGIDVSGLPAAGPLAVRTNAQERQQILDALNSQIRARQTQSRASDAAARAGVFGSTDLAGVTDLSQGMRTGLAAQIGDIDRQATERQTRTAREAAAAERERQRQLRLQAARERAAATAPVDPIALAEARAELERTRRNVVGAGFGDALGLEQDRIAPAKRNAQAEQLELLRERAADTQARRGENELARLQRLTTATQAWMAAQTEQAAREQQQAAEALALNTQRAANEVAYQDVLRRADGEYRRMTAERFALYREEVDSQVELLAAQHRDTEGQRRRVQALTEVRQALQTLLTENEQRLAQARAEGRAQSELNDLIREGIGLRHSMAQVTQEQNAVQREQTVHTREFKDSMVTALGGVADAFGAATVAAIEGQKSFGAALGEMLRQLLSALAKQSVVEVLKNSALGFAALAMGNFAASGNAFTAAGLWAAVGLASGITLAATKPSTAAASTGAPSTASGVRERPQLGSGDRSSGPLTININTSGSLMNSEQLQDAMVRGLNAAHARGVIPRFVRN
jgi:hypothetical protein